jgi:hypothetical protein
MQETEQTQRIRERGMTLAESHAAVDAKVLAAIAVTMKPLSDFTHDQIVATSGVNLSAVKWSLQRLAQRQVVVRAGYIQVDARRQREVYQYIPEHLAFLRTPAINDSDTRRIDLEEGSRKDSAETLVPVGAS